MAHFLAPSAWFCPPAHIRVVIGCQTFEAAMLFSYSGPPLLGCGVDWTITRSVARSDAQGAGAKNGLIDWLMRLLTRLEDMLKLFGLLGFRLSRLVKIWPIPFPKLIRFVLGTEGGQCILCGSLASDEGVQGVAELGHCPFAAGQALLDAHLG